MSISRDVRQTLWRLAKGRCEYCLIGEEDFLAPHEPDHIIAEQHRGPTTLENLALACYECNRHKGPNIASVDPETGLSVFLFHPRQENWSDHFKFEGVRIVPISAKGRATAALLKFNTADRLEIRRLLAMGGRYPV